MKRAVLLALPLVALVAAGLCGCGCSSDSAKTRGRIVAFVSIPPQQYFVERIGGEHVVVEALVQPGQEPHTFEPTLKQMGRVAGADVYFSIRIPFEERLLQKIRATNPKLKVVDTCTGITYRRMETHYHDGAEAREAHGAHEGEREGELDPHTWMSPRLAKVQAANICAGLKQVDPAHAGTYGANLQALVAELDALDTRLAQALAPFKGQPLMVFHPAFGYFADDYGLVQVPIEIEGKEPSLKQLEHVIADAKKEGIRVVFVQPQFSRKMAETVAREIGGAVVPMDDLAKDYIANLDETAAKIEAALEPRVQ